VRARFFDDLAELFGEIEVQGLLTDSPRNLSEAFPFNLSANSSGSASHRAMPL